MQKKELFANEEDEPKLLLTIILIQLVAMVGAILMSRLAKRIGSWWVLTIAVIIWIFICIAGFNVQTQLQFYFLAALVGLVMGGIQSMSRSTYSKLLPATKDTTSFFSFYDVTEKIAIVIGIFTFAYIEEQTENIRNSIIALGSFFVVALLALLYARNAVTQRLKEIEKRD
ncbi:MAG: MFS transporter [Chitinophagaceae bacterium]|nr:MFS transporter [Chitinophagaceae bacterium]